MGCKVSRHVNPIDAALVQALHAAKQRRGKKDFTFNELLLKFSSMAGGFKKAREYFDSMDLNGDKLIDLQEFTTMVRAPPRRRALLRRRTWTAMHAEPAAVPTTHNTEPAEACAGCPVLASPQ